MNKLTALIEAAKAASVLDHNENAGWYGVHEIENAGAYYRKNARFIAECDPATILELCALLEKAEEALRQARFCLPPVQTAIVKETVAAIKQWKEKA